MTIVSNDLFQKLSDLAVRRNRPEWVGRIHDAQHLDIFHPQLWSMATIMADEGEETDTALAAEIAEARAQFEMHVHHLGWSLGAHQWRVPVAKVDEGDEGLFIDINFGKDGSPLKRGDLLYLHPYQYRSAEELLAASGKGDDPSPFNYPEHSIGWHFFNRVQTYVADKIESGIEQSFEQWWAAGGESLTESELGLEHLMQASWRAGVLKGEQRLAGAQAELEQARKQIARMEKALLKVRRKSTDIQSVSDASDALHEAALIPVNLLATPKPAFQVLVREMKESHRTTHWVTLVSGARASDARIWDSEGIMTPMYHENPKYAQDEAQKWAKFLGVEVEQEGDQS